MPVTRAEAEQAAQTGMGLAVDHADRITTDWSLYALMHLIDYAKLVRSPFLVEDAREYAEGRGLPLPPTRRAWGAVVRQARMIGSIVKVGHRNARSSNNSPKCLWCLPDE